MNAKKAVEQILERVNATAFYFEHMVIYFKRDGVRLTSEGGIFFIPRDCNVSALMFEEKTEEEVLQNFYNNEIEWERKYH